MRRARQLAFAALAGALLLLAGCSSYHLEHEVKMAEENGDWDEAVLKYIELQRTDPGNIEYKAGLLRAKIQASLAHFEVAKKYQAAGQLERALVDVDDGHSLPPLVERHRRRRPDPSAADDDDLHGDSASSSVRARRHHTGAFEFRMT